MDLEHLGDSDDIDFYVSLARKLKPRKILELGCGTGRITLPLAEEGARLALKWWAWTVNPKCSIRLLTGACKRRRKYVKGSL